MSPQFNDSIHDLLVKYLMGEANLEEQARVSAWIRENDEHAKAYEHFKILWNESHKLAAHAKPDTDAAWQRMKARLEAAPTEKGKMVRMRRTAAWLRIAALFLLLAGGLWWWKAAQLAPDQSLAVQATSATKTDTLPDGSVVTLNKHSQITYPARFKGSTRTVALRGEAFFEVRPNRQQPFVININDITVRVIGTSFNVSSTNGVTEVIVETGIVQVIRNGKAAVLKPKEKIVVNPRDTVLQKTKADDALYNYYRTRTFVCDNTPLWKLVDILSKAYDARILIGRSELRSLPLTATFRNESLDQVLQVVQETFGISVVKKDGTIILQ